MDTQGRRGLNKQGARAYQSVLEAVLCLPAGALLGWGADALFASAPLGLALGLALGFAAFVLNTVRLPARLATRANNDETPPPAPPPAEETH